MCHTSFKGSACTVHMTVSSPQPLLSLPACPCWPPIGVVHRKCGVTSSPTEFVAGIRRKAWLELQRELSLSKGKCVLDRAREAGLELDEVDRCVGSLLRAARDLTEGDFGAWSERQHWLDVVSYCCSLAFSSAGTNSPREGANDFAAEHERLHDRLFPRTTHTAITGAPLIPPDVSAVSSSGQWFWLHLRGNQ